MSKQRYHIKRDGEPGECNARTPEACPLSASEHFDTMEEAKEYVEELNKKRFGIAPRFKLNKSKHKGNIS